MSFKSIVLLEEPEILALQQQSRQHWAAPVPEWQVSIDEDSLGDPVIWVQVILDRDQQFDLDTSQEEFDKLDGIRKQVREEIAQVGSGAGSMYASSQRRAKRSWLPESGKQRP